MAGAPPPAAFIGIRSPDGHLELRATGGLESSHFTFSHPNDLVLYLNETNMIDMNELDKTSNEIALIPDIQSRIHTFRGVQVMLDRDLAVLYNVETRILNQAVKRNNERFPVEFCFQLTDIEFEAWKSQIVMSNGDRMGLRRSQS